jgi:hypothetical protein
MKSPPRMSSLRPVAARQGGIALIALVAFIGIVAAVFVVRSLNADAFADGQNQRTAEALQAARAALLAYAATDGNRPGALPCPDIDGDGQSELGVEYVGSGCQSYIGRLPWKLLRIPELRDASGETLWYALSPGFRDAGPIAGGPPVVNPDTPAVLTIDGLPGTFGAIVFAPGAALQGQVRSGPAANQVVNYLDGINATPTVAFSAGRPGPAFNDRLLPLSRTDLVAIAERRVSREIVLALSAYFDQHRFLPSPAAFGNVQCTVPDFVPPNGCQALPGVLAGRIPGSMDPNAYAPPGTPWPTSALLRGESVASAALYEFLWFQLQGWREHVVYIVSPNCAGPPATNCSAGTLRLRGATGNVDDARFAVLMAGPAGPGQVRATQADKSALDNYLEGSALSAAQLLASGTAPAEIVVPPGTIAATPRSN